MFKYNKKIQEKPSNVDMLMTAREGGRYITRMFEQDKKLTSHLVFLLSRPPEINPHPEPKDLLLSGFGG